MTKNEWRPVVGYEGLYAVSNNGQVKSLARKGRSSDLLLNLTPDSNGYLSVGLSKNGKKSTKRIHNLVAEAFLGPRPEGQDVCHGTSGKTVNSIDNLSYGSRRKNSSIDRNRDNEYSSRLPGVSLRKHTGKWNAQIQIHGKIKRLGSFDTEEQASEAYNKAYEAVCEVANVRDSVGRDS